MSRRHGGCQCQQCSLHLCVCVCCHLLRFSLTCGQPHTAPASRRLRAVGCTSSARKRSSAEPQLTLLFQWLLQMPPSYAPLPYQLCPCQHPMLFSASACTCGLVPRSALGLQHRTHTPQHCPALTRLVLCLLPARAVRDFTPPAQCRVWHAYGHS